MAKSAPGVCGCGETDTDGDGRADCLDLCPNDPYKVEPGDCGCSDDPEPITTSCGDGLCASNNQCDGAGTCGNPAACAPDASCTDFEGDWHWERTGRRGWRPVLVWLVVRRSDRLALLQLRPADSPTTSPAANGAVAQAVLLPVAVSCKNSQKWRNAFCCMKFADFGTELDWMTFLWNWNTSTANSVPLGTIYDIYKVACHGDAAAVIPCNGSTIAFEAVYQIDPVTGGELIGPGGFSVPDWDSALR